jgi:hypothetical protein
MGTRHVGEGTATHQLNRVGAIVRDWWEDLLPSRPHLSPPGIKEMLRIIVYDIACPKRLRRVAQTCLDFGVRVQKSVFPYP